MDVCTVIKARLKELGLEQKDLAAAAEVTDSYISQLLTGKKLPPAPDRTDIYDKMGAFLRLSNNALPTLARAQRIAELRRGYDEAEGPLLKETRELILRKCVPERREQIRAIFERHPFGELERLVTQKLLDVVGPVARAELDNKTWLHEVAKLSGRSYEQMRVIILEFLDTDIFNVSNEDCVSFLDPLIARWDIDFLTFDMAIALNERLAPGKSRKFAFVEMDADILHDDEPGLTAFLNDATLSGNISDEELEFLRRLRFKGRRPGALYYYRELQNLRDPLHFEFTEN
ncbi:MAG: helix-turn-helix domain-containing protein [Gammaproteobacteria bacterium]|nr:helix-turn-helix domain-containing protein [Gammaproteobacteria bacterium]MDH4255222.1 helix-turn-helix domain-containing protein [Gammaproteobacteria bacterium]MDH5310878.1 helix-turn-helix domain-containing protein [Gammaproteobacteria bacterium]